MKVKRITKTCDACPSQWDIGLVDGTIKYGRLRHGWLYFGRPVEIEWETREGDLGGFMETKDVIPYLRRAGYEVDESVEIVDAYEEDGAQAAEIERLVKERQSMQRWIDHHNDRADKAETEVERLTAALNEIAGYADDRPGDWAAMHARKALGDAS